jgi:8-oxo-dGTP pyrophosphatase MutT (NUDIX family)
MHRRPLLEILARYRRAFPGESPVVDRICALVESHRDCFQRNCRPGHITGAAWILSPNRRRCLLAHHRKLERWLQLGGHADGQWSIENVALREAREESGLAAFEILPIGGEFLPLDVDVHVIPPRFNAHGQMIEDAHEHHDIRFLLVAKSEDDIRTSDESHEVAWFTPDEIIALTHEESVLRMLRKTLDLLG